MSPLRSSNSPSGSTVLDSSDGTVFNVLSKCVRPYRSRLLPGAKLYAHTVATAIYSL